MKYLESYQDNSATGPLSTPQYEKISYEEYVSFVHDRQEEDFIQKEIDFILHYIPFKYSDQKSKLDKRFITKGKVYVNLSDFGLFVNKFNDSWYSVQYTPNEIDYVFYKCDEFIGLQNCSNIFKYNMRYLKIFELYSESFEEIPLENYIIDAKTLEHENFHNSEISYIKSILPDPKNYQNSYSKFWSTGIAFRSDNSINIYINKQKDEWFLIEFWDRKVDRDFAKHYYYKCDQFDGLQKCLNYLLK